MKLSHIVAALIILQCIPFSQSNAAEDSLSKEHWQVRARIIGVVPNEESTTNVGGSVNINNRAVPEVDVTYFWNKHIATEFMLAFSPHDIGTTSATLDFGSVWMIPPTLAMQYHFNPDGKFRPYAGAGLNYTFFADANPGTGAGGRVDYKDNFGYALQGGLDIGINERWMFNLDVKKIFLSTDITANGGTIVADVDIDPWIIGAGIGYKF